MHVPIPSRTHLDIVAAKDALAERSKAVAQGAIPKGRGFEPHRRHFDHPELAHYKRQETAILRKSVLSQQVLL